MAGLFSDNLPQTVPDTSFFQNAPPPQMPQNVLPQSPLPITDAQKIPFWQNIILAKKGYGLTEQNLLKLNEMLANPDLKDEDKKKITDQIDLGNKALEGFSKYAAGVRNAANAIGLDVSDYGSDKTLAESTQALNNYAATAVRDLFAMPSVAEQEQARFDELVARGVRPSQAHRLVKYDHPKVQGDYERRIRDGIMTYGTNPDGSINEVGLSLMHSALSSSPQTTTLFGTALALPKSVFDANNQRDLAILGSDAAMQRAREQLRVQEAIAKANRESQEKRTAVMSQTQRDVAEIKERGQNARTEYVQGETNKRTAAEIESRVTLKSMDLQAGTYGFKFADAYETGLKIFNGDHKKAFDNALDYVSGYKRDKNKKGSAAQGIFNIYDTMFSLIDQGNEDAAGALLERLTAKEEDKLDEFSDKFDEKENQQINALRSAFSKYLDFGKKPDDPKDAKSRQDARDILTAHYLAVKRGTTPEEELAALKNSRATARHNPTNGKPPANSNKADDNVRTLLGDNGGGKPTYTPKPGGSSWTGHYGGF